jgi:hypothetical protein
MATLRVACIQHNKYVQDQSREMVNLRTKALHEKIGDTLRWRGEYPCMLIVCITFPFLIHERIFCYVSTQVRCATRTGAHQPESKIADETLTTTDARPLSQKEFVCLGNVISEQKRYGISPLDFELIAYELGLPIQSVEREGAKLAKECVELVVANETKTTSDARPPNQNEVCRPDDVVSENRPCDITTLYREQVVDDLKIQFLSGECEGEKTNKGSDELLAVEDQQMLMLQKILDEVGLMLRVEYAQIAAVLKNLKNGNKALVSLCEVPLVAVKPGLPFPSVEREGEKINKGSDGLLAVEGRQTLMLKKSIDEVGSKMFVEGK